MTTPESSTGVTIDALCTLPSAERPLRAQEFDELFARAVHDVVRVGATDLDLLIDTAADPAARDLAARETACCSFFRFEFRPAARPDREWLRIGVGDGQEAILDGIALRAGSRGRGGGREHPAGR